MHRENRESRWSRYRELLVGRLLILETTEDVWNQFARMKARQQELGAQVADLDLLIAATAVQRRLILATLNHHDFSRIEDVAWEVW